MVNLQFLFVVVASDGRHISCLSYIFIATEFIGTKDTYELSTIKTG